MSLQYLRDILDDLKARFGTALSPPSFQLSRQLNALDDLDKKLIRKKILELEYDHGALHVIKILSEAGIVNINDYLELQADEDIQGIIADLIDSNGKHELLIDVVKAKSLNNNITTQFQNCFREYCIDVVERPELVKIDFLSTLESRITMTEYRDLVTFFIADLWGYQVDRDEHHESSEVLQVLSNQKLMSIEIELPKYKLLSQIIKNFNVNQGGFIAKKVCKMLQSKKKKFNWFFFLLTVRFMDQDNEQVREEFKKYLKKSFILFCETGNSEDFLTLLIIARQLFFYHPQPFTVYKSWIKLTIGEMNYQLKNQEKFSKILEILQNLIAYEFDKEILEIHCETAISSPRGCNHLVLEYKQMLKTKIASDKPPDEFMDLT